MGPKAEKMTAPIFSLFTIKPSSTGGVRTKLLGRAYTLMFGIENLKNVIQIFSLGKILPFGGAVQISITKPMGILNGQNKHSKGSTFSVTWQWRHLVSF